MKKLKENIHGLLICLLELVIGILLLIFLIIGAFCVFNLQWVITTFSALTVIYGVVFLIINNSLSKTTDIEIPKQAERYTLSAESMRSTVMQLNGKELMLSGITDIPELVAEKQNAGVVTLAPGSCTFLVM